MSPCYCTSKRLQRASVCVRVCESWLGGRVELCFVHVCHQCLSVPADSVTGELKISNHSQTFVGIYLCEVNNAVGAERCRINLKANKREQLPPHMHAHAKNIRCLTHTGPLKTYCMFPRLASFALQSPSHRC